MSSNPQIPSLWASQLKLDVRSPTVILNAQARELERLTKSILRGETMQVAVGKDGHTPGIVLDVIAPVIAYRHRILLVEFVTPGMPYPVKILFAVTSNEMICNTEDEFMTQLRGYLQSAQLTALLQAMIAKTNDTTVPKQPNPTT